MIAFDDGIGFGFLPGGVVIPTERQAFWEELVEELDAEHAHRVTRPQMRKRVQQALEALLAPHGFTFRKGANPDDGFTFERPSEAGRQRIEVRVAGTWPDFECFVYVYVDHASVAQVFCDVFSDGKSPWALGFTLNFFNEYLNSPSPISTPDEFAAVLSLVERKAIPLLDIARTLDGLDRLLNSAGAEAIRSFSRGMYPAARGRPFGGDGSMSLPEYLRDYSFGGLVVARLNGNPLFEDVVRGYGARYALGWKGALSEADFERLLAHLRSNVAPLNSWPNAAAYRKLDPEFPRSLTERSVDLRSERRHHQEVTYQLIELAQTAPKEFLSRFGPPDGDTALCEYWQAIADSFPPEARVDSHGLRCSYERLEVAGLSEAVEVVLLTFPEPRRPHEVYFLALTRRGDVLRACLLRRNMQHRGKRDPGGTQFQANSPRGIGSRTGCAPEKDKFLEMIAGLVARPDW